MNRLYYHLFVLLLIPVHSHAQPFQLESALSAPYCSSLITSPDGSTVGWTVEEAGIRSIYTASKPHYDSRLRFKSPYDDGQILGNLHFDHQSAHLYFVKGSAANRAGEIANPSSEVTYPTKQLLRINLDTDKLDTIGEHPNYVISPDDSYLLLFQGNMLEKYDLENRKIKPVIKMRGSFSDVSFRLGGEGIVFVSNRGDHNFIGYYGFGNRSIDWIAPSLFRDQNPVWSRDGGKIAFIRIPGQRKGELADITGGNEFSIIVYDMSTNEERLVWSSPGEDGGFAQYYHDKPLRWTGDGDLLFYSEHEQYMKVYHLDLKTKEASAVISGNCEVEHSDLSPDGSQLIFSSNCNDIDRRHLFIYNIDSRHSEQITNGEQIETNPYFLAVDQFVYRESGFNFPTRISLWSEVGSEVLFPRQLYEDYPESHLVKPKQVIFKAGDGTEIHGQLFVKNEGGAKPGILFMHGGPIRQMLLGYHYSSYYANAYVLNQYLADQGYAVLSVNYRAGIGYGRDFRRASRQGPRGASEYQDIVAGARYLQSLNYVDAEKIGLWGGSYGGLLTAQGLARNSDIFKAGVDFHGVHDWSWRATDFSKGGFWGIDDDLMDLAYKSSPVSDIEGWKSPVLLIHGDDDRNVMFGQSIDLAERLKEHGVHYEVLVLPDEVHGFYRYASWLRSYRATADFFDRFLKN